MGKHLSKYQTQEDYNNNKDNHLKPHVSLIVNPVEQIIFIPEPSYINQYFTIEAIEDGLTVSLSENASQYRIDNGDWVDLAASTATPSVNTGQKIQFKMENPSIASIKGIGTFTTSKQCNAIGNIMSLLYGGDFEDKKDLTGKNYAFCKLFYNNRNLVNAEKLILPATTLDSYCYASMFQGCTSLVSAPELPATTLVSNCYDSMFNGCSNLNNITMLATDISATRCLTSWVSGVASSGTFVKHPDMTSLTTGDSGIPSGWTVEDYSQSA